MTNVAQKMREVLTQLKREGFGGQRFPEIAPECEERWNDGYAIAQRMYYNYDMESDYFDHDRFKADFEQWVRGQFPGCKVTFYWKPQEIEVCRE